MNDAAGVARAAERVTLACRALSAAARDLHVAYDRNGVGAVDKAAGNLEVEMERVCEMAEQVAALGVNLRRWANVEAAQRAAGSRTKSPVSTPEQAEAPLAG